MKTILVCGTRQWKDADCVHLALLMEPHMRCWDDDEIRVIHGDCRTGADRFAAQSAHDLGYRVKAFPAEWEKYGKKAGPIRNHQMLDEKPDLVIAFGEGRGTNGTVNEAIRRGIQVKRF